MWFETSLEAVYRSLNGLCSGDWAEAQLQQYGPVGSTKSIWAKGSGQPVSHRDLPVAVTAPTAWIGRDDGRPRLRTAMLAGLRAPEW